MVFNGRFPNYIIHISTHFFSYKLHHSHTISHLCAIFFQSATFMSTMNYDEWNPAIFSKLEEFFKSLTGSDNPEVYKSAKVPLKQLRCALLSYKLFDDDEVYTMQSLLVYPLQSLSLESLQGLVGMHPVSGSIYERPRKEALASGPWRPAY